MLHDDITIGAPPKTRRFAGDLWRNLRTGVRLAGLQRVAATDFRASGGQLAAVTGVEFLLDFLLRLAVVGRHGYLETYELPATLFHVPCSSSPACSSPASAAGKNSASSCPWGS